MFSAKTVDRLLRDSTAKGLHRANYTTRDGTNQSWSIKPKSEWTYSQVEAVVSEDLWDVCNYILGDAAESVKPVTIKPVQIFAGLAFCQCGNKIYVPSNSPKYVCQKCRNKIPIVDLEGIFREELKSYCLSDNEIGAQLDDGTDTLKEKEQLLETSRKELARVV